MHKRSIRIAIWNIPGSDAVAVVTVSYPTLAGIRRAYTVDVQPMTLETRDGYTVERYAPREGYRAVLEDAPRYSAKRLDTWSQDPATFETARRMFARICADRGIDAPERFATLA